MSKLSKLFTLLITVTLFSCSGDEGNNSPAVNPPANSLKKVTETTYIAGNVENFSANFNYENGILKSISDPTNRIEITYSNNRISSTIYYKNEVIQNSYSFTYNGNLLQTILNTKNNFERTLFDYNNGILVSEKNQSLIGSTWQTGYTQNYVIANGNIIEENSIFQNNAPYKNTYDYDTKLNPMHYMNPDVRELIGLESANLKTLNNQTNIYNYSNASSTTPILDFTCQITYNAQNLPISIKKYTTSNTLVSEATFEYY
jgi:hypothetical protein